MMKAKLTALLALLAVCTITQSSELVHNFNSPAFSGLGYSSHVLTIYQLEQQQKEKNKAESAANSAEALRIEANKPQNKFKANLESKIYNEIATKVSQSLFNGACSQDTGSCGNIANLAGNSVEWTVDGGMITIKITNLTDPSQDLTMTMPVATFSY
jgi:LytS/YehU family sensor histidine kinase